MRRAIAVLGSGPGLDPFGIRRIRMAVRERRSKEFIIMTGNAKDVSGTSFAQLAQSYAISVGADPKWVKYPQIGFSTYSPDIHGDVRQLAMMTRAYGITNYRVVTEKPHWMKARRLLRRSLPRGVSLEFLDSGNPVTWKYWAKELIAYAISFLPPQIYSFIISIHHRQAGGGS